MKYKLLLPILLVVMLPLSWYTLLTSGDELDEEYNSYLSYARSCMEDGLTEYGFGYYSQALTLKDSMELRVEIAGCYQDLGMVEEYQEWCSEMLEAYPNDIVPYETMMRIYLDNENYSGCYSILSSAAARGVTSEFLQTTSRDIAYKYRISGAFSDVMLMSQNVYAVRSGSYWGFVNAAGSTVIDFKYQSVGNYSADGLAPAMDVEGNEFYIDTQGRKAAIFKQDYAEFGEKEGGVATVKRADGKYVYVDRSGNELSEAYDEALAINGGIGAARVGDEWIIVGPTGQKQFDGTYDDIKQNENGVVHVGGRIFVKPKGAAGYIMLDTAGAQIGSTVFDDAKPFANGEYTAVKLGDVWAFADKSGNLLSDKRYEDARPYSSGIAAVKIDGKWGFVNSGEELIIAAEFDDARDFNSSGGCFVYRDEKWRMLRLYRMG